MGFEINAKEFLSAAAAMQSAATLDAVAHAAASSIKTRTELSYRNPGMREVPWPAAKAAPVTTGKRKGKRRKGRKKRVRQLLIDTGTLMQSWTLNQLKDGEYQVTTPVKYAPYHQFGAPKQGLPARPQLPYIDGKLGPRAEAAALSMAEKKLAALLRKLGFKVGE